MKTTITWATCAALLSLGSAEANDLLAASNLVPNAGAAPAPAADADNDLTPAELAAELARLRARIEGLEGAMTPNLEMSAALSRLEARLDDYAEDDVKVYHKNGLRIEGDGFTYHIGGRIHADWSFADGDNDIEEGFGRLEDGVEIRRARLFMRGSYGDDVVYKVDYELGNEQTELKDMYVRFLGVPGVDSVTVGHQKEAFGLEFLASSNAITFLERATNDIFNPKRNTGIQIHQKICDNQGVFQFGIFRDTDDAGNDDGDGESAFVARVAGTPINENGGRNLLHLGTAYTHRKPDDDEFRFRQRPENHLLQRFVDTGTFDADEIQQSSFEFAYVNGPFHVQAEHTDVQIDSEGADDPNFTGSYVKGSYFLTGEHRPYKNGKFKRIVPNEPAVGKDATGNGAWEVAYRFSTIDLNDGPVMGGEMQNHTFGLNWYLSQNLRLMFNYVLSDVDDSGASNISGDADIFAARLQIDF